MKIDWYKFGKIAINNKVYTRDVIIYQDHVNFSWWREKGHFLQTGDIKEILETKPDIVIIGTGKYATMEISFDVKKEFNSRGICAFYATTEEACKKHNEMSGNNQKVVTALHLTC